jgi:hypothetical protein
MALPNLRQAFWICRADAPCRRLRYALLAVRQSDAVFGPNRILVTLRFLILVGSPGLPVSFNFGSHFFSPLSPFDFLFRALHVGYGHFKRFPFGNRGRSFLSSHKRSLRGLENGPRRPFKAYPPDFRKGRLSAKLIKGPLQRFVHEKENLHTGERRYLENEIHKNCDRRA